MRAAAGINRVPQRRGAPADMIRWRVAELLHFSEGVSGLSNALMQNGGEPAEMSSEAMTAWTLAALVVAVAGVGGSLWLSLGMHLKACPLCLYQRTFMMAAAAVLATGLLTTARPSALLPLLALPVALAGLGVAAFHEYLELTGTLECPAGFLGLGTAPRQSLGVFVLLAGLLAVPALRGPREGTFGLPAVAAAAVLGALFAVGTIKSAPPMPAPPTKPYEQPLEICRPPYRSAIP
jgi:hypothetical protein